MYKVHGYVDNKLVINRRMQYLPRAGDEVMFSDDNYYTVSKVVWCLDEDDTEGQRVNIGFEKE